MRASVKIFVASMLVALAVAWPAYAATNPTQDGYTLRAGVTETSIQKNTPPNSPPNHPKSTPPAAVAATTESSSPSSSGGGLPFTGLELSVVLGVGVVLLGAGLVVRRVSSAARLG